jgi:hypothetical protein
MNLTIIRQSSLSLALTLGTLGGTGLVFTAMFFAKGKYILIPYALLVIGTAVALRTARVRNFAARFVAGLGGFMLASVALYLYTFLVDVPRITGHLPPISLLGHLWRLVFLLLVGAALNLAVARVSDFGSDAAQQIVARERR